MTFSERLMFLLENADMTQTELAEKIGISKQSLYKYLRCGCEPKAEIIAKMALVLHTTADFLVGLTNDYSPAVRDGKAENDKENDLKLIASFRKLSPENQIRIEERIKMLLEQ